MVSILVQRTIRLTGRRPIRVLGIRVRIRRLLRSSRWRRLLLRRPVRMTLRQQRSGTKPARDGKACRYQDRPSEFDSLRHYYFTSASLHLMIGIFGIHRRGQRFQRLEIRQRVVIFHHRNILHHRSVRFFRGNYRSNRLRPIAHP